MKLAYYSLMKNPSHDFRLKAVATFPAQLNPAVDD